jgi:hypothetical protein
MNPFRLAWPICVGIALALSGCVLDTAESDEVDDEWNGEARLELDGVSGEGNDDSSEDQRAGTDDDDTTEAGEASVAVPHVEPDPEPWEPGDGHGSDDG